jgi:hypothetical protein
MHQDMRATTQPLNCFRDSYFLILFIPVGAISSSVSFFVLLGLAPLAALLFHKNLPPNLKVVYHLLGAI